MAIKIEFPRGDSYRRGFTVQMGGVVVTDPFDDIYFTAKKTYTDKTFVLQKRLSTGGITDDGDGHYTLFIEPDDTNRLEFAEYDCDFEFVAGIDKTTFVGKLKLTKEVTYASNE